MNSHGHHWIRDKKRFAIYERDDYRCVYCDASPNCGSPTTLTLDHLLPRELGGSNEASNLVTACLTCNSARQKKGMRTWFAALRAQGINTDKIGPRIRRLVRKELT